MNKIISSLTVEIHLPNYQYCGPGTKLTKRLAKGDLGVNLPDVACKKHDIAQSKYRYNLGTRNEAVKILAARAWRRLKASISSISEKTAAVLVTGSMKLKSKLGVSFKQKKESGLKKKTIIIKKLRTTVNAVIKATLHKTITKSKNYRKVIGSAIKGARNAVNKCGGEKSFEISRISRLPAQIHKALPLIPLFISLSTTGALANGIAGIKNSVNVVKSAKK